MRSYIRGEKAKASCRLIDHLRGLGVDAQVGHVTHGKKRELIAVTGAEHFAKVPDEWQGFRVVKEAKSS